MEIPSEKQMVTIKTWKEFRDTGLLWFINTILHTFGWAICLDKDESGEIIAANPARVRFRGFSQERSIEGYKQVSRYLEDNIKELREEADE